MAASFVVAFMRSRSSRKGSKEVNRLALLIPMVLACSSPSMQLVQLDGGSSATGGGAGGASSGSGGVAGSVGTGAAYALFELDITSSTSPRSNINECRLTITDQNGNLVLDNFLLPAVTGTDSSGNPVLLSGCASGMTSAKIGTFTYSTSQTNGSLTFRVDALDSNDNVVQMGSATQGIETFPPKISGSLTISAPTP